ncbi:diguanylate cyclase domain-containing protein [Halomonas mongoliensis]|uniref:diguanylate cyclase domain-containing protein n=1 Tax=Halomonas mongoliensis TaxID=321265 RepID=UPI00403B2F88
MRSRHLPRWLGLWLWLVLTTPLAAAMPAHNGSEAAAGQAQTLTLGILAYRPKAVIETQWQPLVDYLNASLPDGLKVSLQALTQPEMEEALRHDRLDLIFTNPSHFIELRTLNQLSGALATLATMQYGQPVSHLGGVVIRRAGPEGPDTLEALRQSRIAIVGKQYLGGYAAPSGELKRRGIDPERLEYLVTGGSHDDVVHAVLEGRADAGFIRTGVLESKLRDGTLLPGELEVVEPKRNEGFPFASSTRLYPEWAFVAHWTLPHDISKRVAALLFELSSHDPAARAAGIHGFTIPADYARVEELMMGLRIPPFDAAPEFGWADIWERYQPALVTGLVLASIILALLSTLAVGYRRQRKLHRHAEDLANRLAWTLEGTRAGTWERNVQTGELRINQRWAEMAGYRREELEPATFDTLCAMTHPEDLRQAEQALARHFAGEDSHYGCELRIRHRDGHWLWVYDRGHVKTRTPDGKPEWMFGTHIDITDRHRLIENQQSWIQRFREFADNVPGVLYQFRLRPDGSAHFPFASPRLYEVYGCWPEEVSEDATPVFRRIHPDDIEAVQHSIQASAAALAPWRTTYRVEHPLQGQLWLEGSATPSRQEDGSTVWHGYIRDITELKEHEQELEFIAYYDSLTGIPNRRLLGDRMSQAIAHALRSGEALAICMLDLDNFKPINDTLGHEAGDRVLIEIARRLSGLLRTEDSVARLGGDEFVLLLRNPEGEAVFQRVLDDLRTPIDLEGHEVHVSASLGVAMLNHAAPCDGDQLLRLADQAAYRAKSAGRDRYRIVTTDPVDVNEPA